MFRQVACVRPCLAFGGAALANSLEEDHAGGNGNIEGLDWAHGGKRNDKIATLAREFMESTAFTSHNDPGGRSVIHVRVRFVRRFIQTNKPITRFLEIFHGAREIRDPGDGQVREGPGRSTRDRVRQASGTALGDNDAVDASGQGGANNRAEIVGVLDTVEKNEEAVL